MPTWSNITYALGLAAIIVATVIMLIRVLMYKQSTAKGHKKLLRWEMWVMLIFGAMFALGMILSRQ